MNEFAPAVGNKKKRKMKLQEVPKRVDNFSRLKLECGHSNYHRKCIIDWLKITPECPLCKKVINI